MWSARELGMKRGGGGCWVGAARITQLPRVVCATALPSDATNRNAKILHKVVTAENYGDVGSFDETKAINRPPRREADWATTLHSACSASDSSVFDTTLRTVVNEIGRQRVQRSAPSARGAPSRAAAGNQPGRSLPVRSLLLTN
jgi:hypothetical protein